MNECNGLYPTSRGAGFRALLIICGIVLAAGIPAGCQQAEPSDAELLEQAKVAVDNERTAAAMVALRNAIKKNPRNAEARLLLGDLHLKAENWRGALKELRKANQLGVPLAEVVVSLSKAMLMDGQYRELLIEIPTEMTALNQADGARVLVARGDALALLGETSAAIDSYRRAGEKNANDPLPWIGLSRLYLVENDLPMAEKTIAGAERVAPDNSEVMELRAILLRRHHEYFKALQLSRKILEHDPDYARAVSGAGWNLLHLGNIDEAADYAQRLQQMQGSQRDAALLLASIQLQRGDSEAAETTLQGVKVIGDSSAFELYLRGRVHYSLDQFEQAELLLTRLVKRYPGFTVARLMLSQLYQQTERLEKSVALLSEANISGSLDLMANTQLTIAYLQLGHHQAAIGTLKRIATSNSPAAAQAESVLAMVESGDTHEAMKALTEPNETTGQAADTIPKEAEPIVTLIKAGEFDQAIAAANELSALRPKDPTADNLAALAYRAQGNIPQAKKAFERALSRAPGDPAASTGLAGLALLAGNNAAAIGYYQAALDRHPNHAPVVLLMADAERKMKNFESSEKRLQGLIRLAPSAWPQRVLLAKLYLDQNHPQEALEVLEEYRAFQGTTRNAEVLTELGRAQLALGRSDAAIETLGRAATITPDVGRVHYLLASAYQTAGDSVGYRKHLIRTLELSPSYHFPAGLRLVRLALAEQDIEEARKWLEPIVEKYPERTDTLVARADLAMLSQQPGEAVALYRQALNSHPDPRLVTTLATAQMRANDAKAAQETLEAWVAEHPKDALPLSTLANLQLMLGQAEQGLRNLKRLIELTPDNPVVLNNLALMTWRDDPTAARSYAQRGVVASNENPQALDTLGIILLKTGDSQAAADVFGRALAGAPDNLNFALHKAAALLESGDTGEARRILEAITSSGDEFEERARAEQLLELARRAAAMSDEDSAAKVVQ